MSYEIDADALIDRLIDRLIVASQMNASASYIEAMQKYELIRVEFEQESKARAELQNKVSEINNKIASDKPKLHALWVAADDIRRIVVTNSQGIDKKSPCIKALAEALAAAEEPCDGDEIPF